ncbi:hypothetical protein [Methanococcoides sp.]|uniref:hypothetical protein n=1 Tax=Methanococcoides sp. TaxID=1966350 RepID=UPI00272E8286|nr:hypothetical protein [Methanococcoides sp.]
MLKRKEIGKILILVLLVSFLSFDTVNAADDELNDSENTDSNTSRSDFEEYKNDSLFVASRGNFPEITDQEWKNSVTKCWVSLTASTYTIDSSIKSIGSNNEFLIVHLGFAYQGKMNESEIDEIYRKIDEHCEQEGRISDIPVVFMWAQDEEDMPLPDYGPDIFEEAKSNPSFIAAYGTMPVIKQESEKRRWTDLLGNSKGRELDPFFAEFGGPVIGYGVSINGYLSVGLDSENPEKVNESVIDEIYQTIDSHFEQEAGINEVPVVFEWEERPVEDELEYTSSPGFTSIMLIIGLLLSARSRKRCSGHISKTKKNITMM